MERVNLHTSLWIENCCEGQVKWLCTDYDIDFYISKIVEKSYRDKYMTDYSSLCYKQEIFFMQFEYKQIDKLQTKHQGVIAFNRRAPVLKRVFFSLGHIKIILRLLICFNSSNCSKNGAFITETLKDRHVAVSLIYYYKHFSSSL